MGYPAMTDSVFSPQLHNLRESIKNLEYLISVAENDAERHRLLHRLKECNLQLSDALARAASAANN